MSYESTALRHAPKQLRGQRKVDHILRVAEALFAEVGFENATTNAVAARAGVSIGSLYQFFADKEALIEALADHYIEHSRVSLRNEFATEPDSDPEVFLGRLCERVIKLQEQRPYFLQCLATTRPSQALGQKMDLVIEEYAELLTGWLATRSTETSKQVLKLRARVCVRAITGLLPLALRSRGRERALVIIEIRTVLVQYLRPMLKVRQTV